MRRIQVTHALAAGMHMAPVRDVEVADRPIGEGGFGVVYRVHRIDGVTCAPAVLKLLFDAQPGTARRGFETVQELQRRLADADRVLRETGPGLLDRYPALAATPTSSIEAVLDGRPVLGYLSPDLSASGFEDFGAILDDDNRARAYQRTSLESRFIRSRQLVEAFEFLSSRIGYIHADIKAEALFVDTRRPRVAIIDFDSGAIALKPGDTPTTFGTKQDWLAPEILQQLTRAGNTTGTIRVDLWSDVWSVNVAIHYLIFGFSPYFYFTEVSERSTTDYWRRFKWPAADRSFRYYRTDYEHMHRAYLDLLATRVPGEFTRRLSVTFNEGYRKKTARTSYGQWRTVLNAGQQAQILRFSADRTHVTDSRPVHVTWEVTDADSLHLSGVGRVDGRTSADVVVTRDTTLTLTAKPLMGVEVARTIQVTVSKEPPIITRFEATPAYLADEPEVELAWEVLGPVAGVALSGVGTVPASGSRTVEQRCRTVYELTATSPFGVSSTRRLIVEVSRVAPAIRMLSSTTMITTAGACAVDVRWRVDGAESVRIGRSTGLPGSGRARIFPDGERLRLVARSAFGVESTREVPFRDRRLTSRPQRRPGAIGSPLRPPGGRRG